MDESNSTIILWNLIYSLMFQQSKYIYRWSAFTRPAPTIKLSPHPPPSCTILNSNQNQSVYYLIWHTPSPPRRSPAALHPYIASIRSPLPVQFALWKRILGRSFYLFIYFKFFIVERFKYQDRIDSYVPSSTNTVHLPLGFFFFIFFIFFIFVWLGL